MDSVHEVWSWWTEARPELLALVERLSPEDALDVVRELVKHESQDEAIAMAAGVLRGVVQRRDRERADLDRRWRLAE